MKEPSANSNRDVSSASAGGSNPLSLRDRVQSLRLPERPPPRRSPLALVPWVLCLVFLGTTIVFALRQPPPSSDPDDLVRGDRDSSQSQVGAAFQPNEVMLESKGYIVPVHKIQVSPKVSGMVMSLRFEEGMMVEKGYVLAVLEDIEYVSDRNRALAQTAAAKQRWGDLEMTVRFLILQAEADLEDAKAQHQNEFVQLQSEINSKDATAHVDLLKRKATVDAKMARVAWHTNQLAMINDGSLVRKIAVAKAEYEQCEADLKKAQWRLDNCVVKAPVTGVILTKQAEEGSLVNPSAFSNGLSASLCDMADLGDMEVDLAIPERDVAKLIEFKRTNAKPQLCQVRADALPNRVFAGYVSRIMPIADRGKGAVPVRVKIIIEASDVGVYLRPDMNAAVTFLNKTCDSPVKTLAGEHKQK